MPIHYPSRDPWSSSAQRRETTFDTKEARLFWDWWWVRDRAEGAGIGGYFNQLGKDMGKSMDQRLSKVSPRKLRRLQD